MAADEDFAVDRAPRRKPRPAAKPAKLKDGGKKITLLISRDAKADSILTEALRGVVISLRGALADGGAGEGTFETADGEAA